MYINPPLTAVCVFNACDFDNTQKSNYYNDDLLSWRISVVQNISHSSRKKEEDTTTTKKNTDEKERQKHKSNGCSFFLRQKNLFLLLFSACFRVRRIIWCVNSRLFSLLNRLVQRDTQRHEEDKEEGGRGRLCVLWW